MESRKDKERELHNILRDKRLISSKDFEYLTINKKWYSVVRNSRNFVKDWLNKKCTGKRVLDYCCGNGNMSLAIAEMGAAEVIGIDISNTSIENAKRHAVEQGLNKKVKFFVMDAENMDFDKNFFDVILESGVLHHLELKKAYAELARVLHPDGTCICIEALGHNKIIHLYRKRTPQLRTAWEAEHILCKKDIESAKEYFNNVEIVGFFHLVTLIAVPFRNIPVFNIILNTFEAIDRILLKLPVLKWQAWQVVFVLSKPKK